jgi:hypothetical protein
MSLDGGKWAVEKPRMCCNYHGNKPLESNMTNRIGRYGRTLIVVVLFVTCGNSLLSIDTFGQGATSSDPIENRLPNEALARPEVLADLERLRSLRKSAARFGNKHPTLKSTLKQIEEVERSLENYLDKGVPLAPAPDEKNKSSGLGLEGLSVFPEVDFGTRAFLTPAYPSLALPAMAAVGRFPALGWMWGIEQDSQEGGSRVWRWSDLQDVSQKTLYFASDDRLEALVFPPNFEQNTMVYLMRTVLVSPQEKRVEVLEVSAERLPPFSLGSISSSRILFETKIPQTQPIGMVGSDRDDLLLALGEIGDKSSVENGWELKPTKSSWVWRLAKTNRQVFGSTELKSDGFLANWQQGDLNPDLAIQGDYRGTALESLRKAIVSLNPGFGTISFIDVSGNSDQGNSGLIPNTEALAKTSRGLTAGAFDSSLEPLFIDGHGILLSLKFQTSKDDTQTRRRYLPSRLSRTGWFDPVHPGVLIPAFVPFSVTEPLKQDDAKIQSESFLAIPKGTRVRFDAKTGICSFPAGSVFLQSFRKDFDGQGSLVLKTLGLIRNQAEWVPFVYTWESSQQDAYLEDEGYTKTETASSEFEAEFNDARKAVNYSNCLGCHQGQQPVLGLKLGDAKEAIVNTHGQSRRLTDYLRGFGYLGE